MKRELKKNRGFSLIELIIVVAILAILTGLLAPQFVKYIEKSKKSVCMANMDTIMGEYQVSALENPSTTLEGAVKLLSDIVALHDGSAVSGSTSFYTGGFYSGFCKSGGIYNCMLSENFAYLGIDCTKHGEGLIDVETLYQRLSNISLKDDMPNSPYVTLNDYFNSSRTSIDSEAKGTDNTAYSPYKSLADALNHKLIQQGINTTNRSWRLYKEGQSYNLYLTGRTISLDDVENGSWIACDKYDITGMKTEQGYVQIIQRTVNNSTYPVIKGDSFTTKEP